MRDYASEAIWKAPKLKNSDHGLSRLGLRLWGLRRTNTTDPKIKSRVHAASHEIDRRVALVSKAYNGEAAPKKAIELAARVRLCGEDLTVRVRDARVNAYEDLKKTLALIEAGEYDANEYRNRWIKGTGVGRPLVCPSLLERLPRILLNFPHRYDGEFEAALDSAIGKIEKDGICEIADAIAKEIADEMGVWD